MSRYFSKLAQRTGLNRGLTNSLVQANKPEVPIPTLSSVRREARHDDLAVIQEVRAIRSSGDSVKPRRVNQMVKDPVVKDQVVAGKEKKKQTVGFEPIPDRFAVNPTEAESLPAAGQSVGADNAPVTVDELKDITVSKNLEKVPVKRSKTHPIAEMTEIETPEKSLKTDDLSEKLESSRLTHIDKPELREIHSQESLGKSQHTLERVANVSIKNVDGSNSDIQETGASDPGITVSPAESVGSPENQPISQTSKIVVIEQVSAAGEKKSGENVSHRKQENVEIKIGTISMEIFQATPSKPEPQVLVSSPVVKNNTVQPPLSRLNRFYLKGW